MHTLTMRSPQDITSKIEECRSWVGHHRKVATDPHQTEQRREVNRQLVSEYTQVIRALLWALGDEEEFE